MSVEADRERVIDAAVRLFSELGFDSTSLELIAETADVDRDTLADLVGGKADLYRAVMNRIADVQRIAGLDDAAGFVPTRQELERRVNAYMDFHMAHPEYLRLWVHRWTGDAADISDLEAQYLYPRVSAFVALLHEATGNEVDIDMTVWALSWLIAGFLSQRVPLDTAERGERRGPSQQELERFRAFIHTFLEQMLPLPERLPEESSHRK
jgi:AcrR family transcriptional regulator